MRITRIVPLIAVVSALALCLAAQAQDKDDQPATGKTTTVTGCLAKGDEPNEFYLTADNGKRYEVRSDNMSLGEHIGHRITVTGTTAKESGEEEERGEGKQKEGRESSAGNLQVTNVQMLSAKCK